MNNGNSTLIKSFSGDINSLDGLVNNFITTTPGIIVLGGSVTFDPTIAPFGYMVYILMYKIK